MDTFDIECPCGVIAEVRVPPRLSVKHWHCPGCGETLTVSTGRKIMKPQHDTSQSPAPQYDISAFRDGDYS